MTLLSTAGQVRGAYDVLAPYYDDFTADYAYDPWFAAIERRARALGLRGGRALDLACGTGNSTAPLLSRGYAVVGCDISPCMVRAAREKHAEQSAKFCVADMRELPPLGEFDLVLCLDDAINYLLSEEELEATFRGVRAVLAPGGVFAFDANSLFTYRTSFAGHAVKEGDGVLMAWQGEASPEFACGDVATARVAIFSEGDNGAWRREEMRHVQRHHPPGAMRAALAGAGLSCTMAGQHPGAKLESDADDERHIKIVYFARHADETASGTRRGRARWS